MSSDWLQSTWTLKLIETWRSERIFWGSFQVSEGLFTEDSKCLGKKKLKGWKALW